MLVNEKTLLFIKYLEEEEGEEEKIEIARKKIRIDHG
jgi:hypothetical protein